MNKNTICILPFINTTIERSGDYMICPASVKYSSKNVNKDEISVAWNSDYHLEVRKALIEGVKHDNCKTCWYHEEHGFESRRQQSNKVWLEKYKDRINSSGIVSELPNQLSIKVDNTCNLKCITCNQYHSNQIEKEIEFFDVENIEKPKWFKIVDSFKGHQIDFEKTRLTENVSKILTNASYLEIEGGEPLTHPLLHKILDYCIEKRQFSIGMQITTNLTNLSDKLVDKLKRFNNILLGVSWDHIEADKFSYIRYPANYEKFLENFETLTSKLPKIIIDISFTVSVFNVFDVPKILDHFELLRQQNKIRNKIIYRHVFQPDYFSPTYLSIEQKSKISKTIKDYIDKNKNYLILQNTDLLNVLSNIDSLLDHPSNYEDVVTERKRLIDVYDRMRNTDTYAMFPYLKNE